MNRDKFIQISTTVQARANDFERNLLETLAAAEGVNKSEALRIALREAVSRRGLWKPAAKVGAQDD
jgi:hypothetical protein